ncbi:type II secretion system minor pseudopilin GspI [Phytopseudomonas dryadis]|uniref:Type II secretion system protein I n=1 Tax=Phytopseudomonas dryadis TaxID=2487520 RepID=A0ABY1Z218_9GAMM|nr:MULTISPECIES: type II secretion system minor pseudopilin GspI [Pseudomonas]TBU99717.1 type II secretion system protein GspI [Pseudomonas dryadis]TBV12672.1 type II secretion system protein GspI [Pseudomonas sp. FRB 230]
MDARADRGFTLLEVLVALAIFAVVAASVLTAASRSLIVAEQLQLKTLAGWIADNRITELQLQTPAPGPGRDSSTLGFGGRQWEIQSEVEATSDKGMRRVTVWVAPKAERGGAVAISERAVLSLIGFLLVRE